VRTCCVLDPAEPLTLVLLRTHLDSAMFWLTAAAVVVFLAGPILTSRFAAEPLYDVMLGWDADDPPPGWQAARDRYYRINAVRMSSSLIAFALLTAALAQPTP